MYLTKMEKQRIEQIVHKLLTRYEYNDPNNNCIDIVKFANSVGFRVGESKKLSDIDDGFIFISENKEERIIGVNYNRTLEEKRFIVAHELAHYYLHYNKDLKGAYMHREHIKGKNEIENDADFFAACILMPKESFLEKYSYLKNKKYDTYDIVDALQSLYQTPRESILRRIEEVKA